MGRRRAQSDVSITIFTRRRNAWVRGTTSCALSGATADITFLCDQDVVRHIGEAADGSMDSNLFAPEPSKVLVV